MLMQVFITLLAWWSLTGGAWASESCCAKAATLMKNDVDLVPDLSASKPDSWDDEEDGPWERPLIPRPKRPFTEMFRKELADNVADACPWLLLGLLAAAAVHALPLWGQHRLSQSLAEEDLLGVSKAVALGLASPLCSCGTAPLMLALADAGAAPRACVAFQVAAQAAGVDSLLFTVGLLGPKCAAARMAAAAFVATVVGMAAPRRAACAPSHISKSNCHGNCGEGAGTANSPGMLRRCIDGIVEALTRGFEDVAPPVLLGLAAVSALAAAAPGGGLGPAVALGGVPARAAVLALSLPLQFCEHAAVPLASALGKGGASGGLAFAVLSTMPATSAGALAVLQRVIGLAGVARVAIAVWASGLMLSFAADAAGLQLQDQPGHNENPLPEWFVMGSQYVLGLSAVLALMRVLGARMRGLPAVAPCCKDD